MGSVQSDVIVVNESERELSHLVQRNFKTICLEPSRCLRDLQRVQQKGEQVSIVATIP